MKRREVLKTLTAMTAMPIGSLIIGNSREAIAHEVPAAHVPAGEYFLFYDPAAIDPNDMAEALTGNDSITVCFIPVMPAPGKTVSEVVAIYKVGDQVKEVSQPQPRTNETFGWFTDGGTLPVLNPKTESKKNG